MSAILQSASVARVRQALADAGVSSEVVELPGAARTAKDAARFLGCEVGQIANSLVFRAASGEPLLVMSSGARRVDLARLGDIIGEPVTKADADFVRQATGFAIGGVPPLGHPAPMRTLVDASLQRFATVWCAAGTPNAVFEVRTDALIAALPDAEVREVAEAE